MSYKDCKDWIVKLQLYWFIYTPWATFTFYDNFGKCGAVLIIL